MALFLNLYVGHLLGDFLLQPGRLVLAKRRGVAGVLVHGLLVLGVTGLVLVGTLERDWSAVVLVAALHVLVEPVSIAAYQKTPARGLFTLLLDQALHLLAIAAVVWGTGLGEVDGDVMTFGVAIELADLAYVCGVLVVTLFGSILSFESGNTLRDPKTRKGAVLKTDAARLGGMVERAAALLAALLVHPALVLVPFAPRALLASRKRGEDRAVRLAEVATGLVLCTVVWAAIRLLVHGV